MYIPVLLTSFYGNMRKHTLKNYQIYQYTERLHHVIECSLLMITVYALKILIYAQLSTDCMGTTGLNQ